MLIECGCVHTCVYVCVCVCPCVPVCMGVPAGMGLASPGPEKPLPPTELESQSSLPKSDSRVSREATTGLVSDGR